MSNNGLSIETTKGKLGILMPGLGAVSTTFIAGVFAVLKGIAAPVGSLTQMGTIRIGKRTDDNVPAIKDFVPLANLEDIVFGSWDIFTDNSYLSAKNAGVLEEKLLDQIKTQLESITPMTAVFET
ncbi:inositol-3-phosphate synthase, partial [candidate division KSB1 bacterium]|nr:inositol-3-phosphate synthase [candidate division KSB1 bacterium]